MSRTRFSVGDLFLPPKSRQAVLVASCQVFTPLGSRGAVLLHHVVNGGPEGSINNKIFIPDRVSPFRYVVGQPHVIH